VLLFILNKLILVTVYIFHHFPQCISLRSIKLFFCSKSQTKKDLLFICFNLITHWPSSLPGLSHHCNCCSQKQEAESWRVVWRDMAGSRGVHEFHVSLEFWHVNIFNIKIYLHRKNKESGGRVFCKLDITYSQTYF
jgi:hypothetical protein